MKSERLKVLLVDDERVFATTMAMILQMEGYVAEAVHSGEDAVATVRKFKPDFLVSDVIMLGMTGIGAAIEIRRFCPGVRVILYSIVIRHRTCSVRRRDRISGSC
jgi:CheY-like chemotaxis protein